MRFKIIVIALLIVSATLINIIYTEVQNKPFTYPFVVPLVPPQTIIIYPIVVAASYTMPFNVKYVDYLSLSTCIIPINDAGDAKHGTGKGLAILNLSQQSLKLNINISSSKRDVVVTGGAIGKNLCGAKPRSSWYLPLHLWLDPHLFIKVNYSEYACRASACLMTLNIVINNTNQEFSLILPLSGINYENFVHVIKPNKIVSIEIPVAVTSNGYNEVKYDVYLKEGFTKINQTYILIPYEESVNLNSMLIDLSRLAHNFISRVYPSISDAFIEGIGFSLIVITNEADNAYASYEVNNVYMIVIPEVREDNAMLGMLMDRGISLTPTTTTTFRTITLTNVYEYIKTVTHVYTQLETTLLTTFISITSTVSTILIQATSINPIVTTIIAVIVSAILYPVLKLISRGGRR